MVRVSQNAVVTWQENIFFWPLQMFKSIFYILCMLRAQMLADPLLCLQQGESFVFCPRVWSHSSRSFWEEPLLLAESALLGRLWEMFPTGRRSRRAVLAWQGAAGCLFKRSLNLPLLLHYCACAFPVTHLFAGFDFCHKPDTWLHSLVMSEYPNIQGYFALYVLFVLLIKVICSVLSSLLWNKYFQLYYILKNNI